MKMTFKLENIKVEGNKEQKIIGDYSFNKKDELGGDRTFCLTQLFCGEYESCGCQEEGCAHGEYSWHFCDDKHCYPYDG
jgi:hypothetical protein